MVVFNMDKSRFKKLIDFVSPFYDDKDVLHGIEHIERMLYTAKEIIEAENLDIDFSIIIYGAYFHGLASQIMADIESYLVEHQLPSRVLPIATESLGKSVAETQEGKVLSDAHTLEGGEYMGYLKPLLTGTYMHQSLDDTFTFIENNILDKGSVYFEFSRQVLDGYNQEINELHLKIKAGFEKKYTRHN
jgi:uncharacterized protein